MRHLIISAALLILAFAHPVEGQPAGSGIGGLGDVPPPGGASLPNYFILTHPQQAASANVIVRPSVGQPIPPIREDEPVDVIRVSPSNPVLRDVLRINWAASARCGSGLQTLTINGPGGARSQSFPQTRRAIAGRTNYQSFLLSAVDGVCIAWAQGVLDDCGWSLEPGQQQCPSQETFSFDADNPMPGNPSITVGGSCASGIALAERHYQGRLLLTCMLSLES